MPKKRKAGFYTKIASDVVRDDWRRKKENYPKLFSCNEICKWFDISPRSMSYRLYGGRDWEITFEELCRYADATGNDIRVLFTAIMNRIDEIDGGHSNKRQNSEIKTLMEFQELTK